MTARTDERKQFLTDVLTTAVEGGINYRSAWPNLITWLPDGTLETESIQWSCGGVVLSETEDRFLTEWNERMAA